MSRSDWPLRLRWGLLAAAAIALVVHSLAYNFVTDDAYISFVFSRNLAEHGELTFNLGQPVEGYTNFLCIADPEDRELIEQDINSLAG